MFEKIKKYLNSPFVFAVVLNAAALLVSVTLFVPFFEENDDAFICMIAEGAYGAREVHLIYTNVILGSIYKSLYSSFPGIRWHSVLQYVFLFTAFTTLTYVIQCMRPVREDGQNTGKSFKPNGRTVAALIVLSTFYEVYVSVQYSKTATIVCAIGYMLLLYGTGIRGRNSQIGRKGSGITGSALNMVEATGIILLVYGMLLRDSSFLLASLMMLPVCIYEFLSVVKDNLDKRTIRIYVFTFAPILIWFLATRAADARTYADDEAWKSFMEYNETRMELLDFRYDLLDQNKYGDRLKALDISENDSLLYVTWQFGDDTVLDKSRMEEILNGAPGRWTVISCLKALAQHLYEDVLILNPLLIGTIFFVTAACAAMIGSRNRGRLLSLLSQLMVFCGIIVYYEYCGRWSHRIVFAAMLVAAVSSAYLYAESDDSSEFYRGGICIFVLLAASCAASLLGNRLDYNSQKREKPDYRTFFENIGNDKDTLYIADTFSFQYAYRYDVFKPYREGDMNNFAAVGSWFVNSPITKTITQNYGYENPFRALAFGGSVYSDGGKVILVDNMYADQKLEYLREHYGEILGDIDIKELGEVAGLREYEIEVR